MWRVADVLRVAFESPSYKRCEGCDALLACDVHDPHNRKMSAFKTLFRIVRQVHPSGPVFTERPEWDLLLGLLVEATDFLLEAQGPELPVQDLQRLHDASSRVTQILSDLLGPHNHQNKGTYLM